MGANILVPDQVFISYSHLDEEFANKIATDLERAGIHTWIDRTSLPLGTENWNKAISDAIGRSFAVIFLASPNSGQSNVVQGELILAQRKGCPIYPVWIAGKWEDSVPLTMLYMQYVDCREGRYSVGLPQIIEILNKVIDAYVPKHFSFKLEKGRHQLNSPPFGYLYIALDEMFSGHKYKDEEIKVVGMRPSAYQSLQGLLDDLYINYLRERYLPFSYGKDWILATSASRAQRLIVPWTWFVEKTSHQAISTSNPSWFIDVPEAYGLVANKWWSIIDNLSIFTFGVVTNHPAFGKHVLLDYLHDYSSYYKAALYFDFLLNTNSKYGLKVMGKGEVNVKEYQFAFIFRTEIEEIANKVFILSADWVNKHLMSRI